VIGGAQNSTAWFASILFAIEKMPTEGKGSRFPDSGEPSEDRSSTISEIVISNHPRDLIGRSLGRDPREKGRKLSIIRDEIQAVLIVEWHPGQRLQPF
jgi:hypothetical protein